jgi:hypothetical protein
LASDGYRSRESRDLAEHALAAFGARLGEHIGEVVVIGGLNPDFLAAAPPVAHQGTMDVDLLLEVALVYERENQDFSWLERALIESGFAPLWRDDAWRWQLDLGRAKVLLDLLCDTPDNLGRTIALPGCTDAVAMNLPGPAPAAVGSVLREIRVPAALQAELGSENPVVQLRFAGLGGYLLAKASAVLRRGLDKDHYDFAYVLLYSGKPPAAVVEAIRSALVPPPLSHDALGDLRAVLTKLAGEASDARSIFVKEMMWSDGELDRDLLDQDLRTAADRCLRALDE